MSVPAPLSRLAEQIGAAITQPPDAMAQSITAALREATLVAGWLPSEKRHANHDNYARHLLYADPAGRFSILSIVWDHGQMSPVHAHLCWCAVGIVVGELSEAAYREGAAGAAPVRIGGARRTPGTQTFDAANSGIHRISNESGAPAISLHVYGVAKDRISTGVNRIYA